MAEAPSNQSRAAEFVGKLADAVGTDATKLKKLTPQERKTVDAALQAFKNPSKGDFSFKIHGDKLESILKKLQSGEKPSGLKRLAQGIRKVGGYIPSTTLYASIKDAAELKIKLEEAEAARKAEAAKPKLSNEEKTEIKKGIETFSDGLVESIEKGQSQPSKFTGASTQYKTGINKHCEGLIQAYQKEIKGLDTAKDKEKIEKLNLKIGLVTLFIDKFNKQVPDNSLEDGFLDLRSAQATFDRIVKYN